MRWHHDAYCDHSLNVIHYDHNDKKCSGSMNFIDNLVIFDKMN